MTRLGAVANFMLFSPGPTEIEASIREIGSSSLPYFRGEQYMELVRGLTEDAQYLMETTATLLVLTASGSGVMEMAVQNLTEPGDRVVTINGGSWGQKWSEICNAYGLDTHEMKVELGQHPDMAELESLLERGAKALFVTAHETSTGYLFDCGELGALARKHEALFIVDAMSSIGADDFPMDKWGCDCVVTSSGKALACMPGVSFIALSERGMALARKNGRPKHYFDAVVYERNSLRGMLPYTPAVATTMQLAERLRQIRLSGRQAYIDGHKRKALAFRELILNYEGFSIFPLRSSNSMSCINLPPNCHMSHVIRDLAARYDWYLAPNPTGVESYLRISHMGDLSMEVLASLAERINESCNRQRLNQLPQGVQ